MVISFTMKLSEVRFDVRQMIKTEAQLKMPICCANIVCLCFIDTNSLTEISRCIRYVCVCVLFLSFQFSCSAMFIFETRTVDVQRFKALLTKHSDICARENNTHLPLSVTFDHITCIEWNETYDAWWSWHVAFFSHLIRNKDI